jgi:GntR family transcriptional repressor for pyruvate dehydrogenase complex
MGERKPRPKRTGATPYSFKPVERAPRLSDTVAQQLLDSIFDRGLRPGDRLPSERELGEQFGVSRTVIREAVRSLVAVGVIEARPGTGLSVAAVDAASVTTSMSLYLRGIGEIPYEKLHEIRTMIEVQVAGRAAERATDLDIAALQAVLARFEESSRDGDVEQCADADVEFHRRLARATHNELYLVMLDSIGDILHEIRRQAIGAPGSMELAASAHAAILERVAARDPEGARRAMQAHLDDALEAWRRLGRPVPIPGAKG